MEKINSIKVRLPLRKVGLNKIVLDIPSITEQIRTVFIISINLMSVFLFLMYLTSKTSDNKSFLGFYSFFVILLFGAGFYIYGVESRLYFYLDTKQIKREGIFLFFPYEKIICNFSDIASLEVKSVKVTCKYNSYTYKHYLVYSTVKNPKYYITIVRGNGIKIDFSVKQLNEIGKDISQIIGVRFAGGISTE